MSKPFGSALNTHTFSVAPSSPQNVPGSQNNQTSTSSPAQSMTLATLSSGNGATQHSPSVTLPLKKLMKTKKRTEEEIEITRKAAERYTSRESATPYSHSQPKCRFSARLALDHAAVLQPDVDAPFTDQVDALQRLLPYHIYCQPHEDLELLKGRKGKQKATDADLKAEIEGIQFPNLKIDETQLSLSRNTIRVGVSQTIR